MIETTILQGDCREVLKTLPDESVQCCVSSPPYYGLRSYLPKDHPDKSKEIGSEETPEQLIQTLVEVFREVRRVLRSDGTCWINFGDSMNFGKTRTNEDCAAGGFCNSDAQSRTIIKSLGPKQILGMPWRLAFALQADGWILRQDIIWHKPNPMPESVTDRCTKSHEYIFLLTKSPRYYFDAEAISEACSENTHARIPGNKTHKGTTAYLNGDSEEHRTKAGLVAYAERQRSKAASWKGSEFHTGKTGEHQLGRSSKNRPGVTPKSLSSIETGSRQNESFAAGTCQPVERRNKRSVWTVGSAPFKEAHFATFPPDLIRPCILAGSKPGDTVLDPFGGSGTTAQVANEYGRNAIVIELNADYIPMIKQRTQQPGLCLPA